MNRDEWQRTLAIVREGFDYTREHYPASAQARTFVGRIPAVEYENALGSLLDFLASNPRGVCEALGAERLAALEAVYQAARALGHAPFGAWSNWSRTGDERSAAKCDEWQAAKNHLDRLVAAVDSGVGWRQP